jgi:hypothetical protein
MNKELLTSIVIPNFITKVQIAKERRPIYYEKNGKIKVPESKLKHIKNGKFKYDWQFHKIGSSIKELLTDLETKLPVLKNPLVAGKSKYLQIKGNLFYSGFSHFSQRILVINAIKDDFREYFKQINEISSNNYPLEMEYIFFDEIVLKKEKGKNLSQDLDNKIYPYKKSIQDLMVSMKIIPEDTLEFIRKSSEEFIHSMNKRLIVNIYKYEINNKYD